MTDEKMEHYRLSFEDGLVSEEMAVHLPKPASGAATPCLSWLEEWKQFLKPTSTAP